jgi:hypothetical protein
VDPDIPGNRVGENNTQLFSWYWPGDDESILPIVTSIVDMTILSFVNAAIASLPDPSEKIRKLCGCLEEPIVDSGLYARNVTSIFDSNPAAGWVKAAMKLSNLTLCCVVYRGHKPMGQMVPRCLCMVAAATFLWMTSSHLQPRI